MGNIARAQDSTLAIVYCSEEVYFNVLDSVFKRFCDERFLSLSDSKLHFLRVFFDEAELTRYLKKKEYGKKLYRGDYFVDVRNRITYADRDHGKLKRHIEPTLRSYYKFKPTEETKIILGYLCKAAIFKNEESEIYIWYTEQLQPGTAKFWYANAPGVVLEVTQTYNAKSYHYIATKIFRVETKLSEPTNIKRLETSN